MSVRVRPDGSAYFDGLQTCGSIWACPVCAAKIRQRRAEEIRAGVERHTAAGGGAATGVLTLPHDSGDGLAGTLDAVAVGWRRVQGRRAWRRLKDELGLIGTVRSIEVTHGPNGWHPHAHVLYLFSRPPSACALARLESYVYGVWADFVEGRGYRRPRQRLCHVEPVRCEREFSDYLAKVVGSKGWDVTLEMTRQDLKDGRGPSSLHRSPWQILRGFAETGDCADLDLWLEFERCTKGRRAITWSRGLKAVLGVDEQTDEELAEEEQGGACVALLTGDEWKALCRRPYALCDLLERAERGDPAEVRAHVMAVLYGQRAGP